jgi:signal peptidase I
LEVILEVTQPENRPEIQAQVPKEEKINAGRIILDIIETVVLAVVLFVGINTVSARVRVDGVSMNPTLQNGEFILVNRLAYRFGEVQRGDIIVFHHPEVPQQDLIKRIIGLPGDEIVIDNGSVRLNGELLDEPYIAAAPVYNGQWLISEGTLFVLGDNRNNSEDSHKWGLLPIDNVLGRAILIYWPPPQWTVIRHSQLQPAGSKELA